MTRGEEDYQDKVDPVVHVVKYAFDLFAISWCGKLRIAIKKIKKKGWFVDVGETNQYAQATFNHRESRRGLCERQHSRLLKLLVAPEGFA
jgi:hypothetical protein